MLYAATNAENKEGVHRKVNQALPMAFGKHSVFLGIEL